MKFDSRKLFPFFLLLLFFASLVAYAGWFKPTAIPTGGNVAAPLAPTGEGQFKAGGLWLNSGGSSEKGLVVLGDDDSGYVGIGTDNPGAKLDLVGSLYLTGIIKPNGNAGSNDQILGRTTVGRMDWVNRYAWLTLTSPSDSWWSGGGEEPPPPPPPGAGCGTSFPQCSVNDCGAGYECKNVENACWCVDVGGGGGFGGGGGGGGEGPGCPMFPDEVQQDYPGFVCSDGQCADLDGPGTGYVYECTGESQCGCERVPGDDGDPPDDSGSLKPLKQNLASFFENFNVSLPDLLLTKVTKAAGSCSGIPEPPACSTVPGGWQQHNSLVCAEMFDGTHLWLRNCYKDK